MGLNSAFDFDDICARIRLIDEQELERFNASRVSGKYALHRDLGPNPFEGNINTAPVALLLANPSSNDVESGDHRAPESDWPLHGLGPNASPALRRWWTLRLRKLADATKRDMQSLSKTVAALQLNPWASQSYHPGFRSDSRQIQFQIAQAAMSRGTILVLMRAKREWSECPGLTGYKNLVETINKRCSYLTPGNIDKDSWRKIVSAIGDQAG